MAKVVELSAYPNLRAALAAVGASKVVLLADQDDTIRTNETVPANVTLRALRGAILTVNPGATLTLNGPVEAGIHRVFSQVDSTAFVDLEGSPTSVVRPEWFQKEGETDWALAINRAFNTLGDATHGGGVVLLEGRTYNTASTIYFSSPGSARLDGSGRALLGQGRAATRIKYSATEWAIEATSTTNTPPYHYVLNCLIRGVWIEATHPASKGAFEWSGFTSSKFEDFVAVCHNGTTGIDMRGRGLQGSSPYSNVFDTFYTGSASHIGLQCAPGPALGPHANHFLNYTRAGGNDIFIDHQIGRDNVFDRIHAESVATTYFKLGGLPLTKVTGKATGGTSTTLEDTAACWNVDEHVGKYVWLTSGAGLNQVNRVQSNTARVLTLSYQWGTTVPTTEGYAVSWVMDGTLAATTGDNESVHAHTALTLPTLPKPMTLTQDGLEIDRDRTTIRRQLATNSGGTLVAKTAWDGVNIPQAGDAFRIYSWQCANIRISHARQEGSAGCDHVDATPHAWNCTVSNTTVVTNLGAGKLWKGLNTAGSGNRLVSGDRVWLRYWLDGVPANATNVVFNPQISTGLPFTAIPEKVQVTGIYLQCSKWISGELTATVTLNPATGSDEDHVLKINRICRNAAFTAPTEAITALNPAGALRCLCSTDSAWADQGAQISLVIECVAGV